MTLHLCMQHGDLFAQREGFWIISAFFSKLLQEKQIHLHSKVKLLMPEITTYCIYQFLCFYFCLSFIQSKFVAHVAGKLLSWSKHRKLSQQAFSTKGKRRIEKAGNGISRQPIVQMANVINFVQHHFNRSDFHITEKRFSWQIKTFCFCSAVQFYSSLVERTLIFRRKLLPVSMSEDVKVGAANLVKITSTIKISIIKKISTI